MIDSTPHTYLPNTDDALYKHDHAYRLGRPIDAVPIALVEADTRYVEAGPLRVGIEFRSLDRSVQDMGLSIHVFDAASGAERLRFDVFKTFPHYHYIRPTGTQQIVRYDQYAFGPMLDWVYGCLRGHMATMLRFGGDEALADAVDQSSLDAAMPEIEKLARQAAEESFAATPATG